MEYISRITRDDSFSFYKKGILKLRYFKRIVEYKRYAVCGSSRVRRYVANFSFRALDLKLDYN